MATKLNNMLCESAVTVTPEHTMNWDDQSGQDHGPLSILPRYGSFAISGAVGPTGNTTNTSQTITNVTNASAIANVGDSITGPGIPVSTTITAVGATTLTISNAATATATGVALVIDGFGLQADTNTSNTLTNVIGTVRARIGETIAGTDIPGGTTITAIDYAVDTITMSAAATGSSTNVPLTLSGDFTDPVISYGYNVGTGTNSEITAHQGSAGMVIEGHFERDTSGSAWMEAYFQFDINGSSGQARPFFFAYDKVTAEMQYIQLSPGPDQYVAITFEDFIGDSGGPAFEFFEGLFKINAPPKDATVDCSFQISSNSGQQSTFLMSANGDNVSTKPTLQCIVDFLGGSSQHRQVKYIMSDDTAAKTGAFLLRADSDLSGANSVMCTFGNASSLNQALFHITSVNFATNLPTFKTTAKASQTRAVLEIDGQNNTISTIEARKAQLYPKGYWAYRESGNTTTDRTPGTGANTVTLPTTNCPGTGTSTAWFPMLDTSGALYWVPAVSQA